MNISTFSIYNINPNSVAETNTGFVPVTVTNLMLRNCNILTPSSSFMRELDPVSELVVEEHPHRVWASLHTSRLESLYTHGNEIKDFNVSKDLFAQIQGLTAFIITIGSHGALQAVGPYLRTWIRPTGTWTLTSGFCAKHPMTWTARLRLSIKIRYRDPVS
ncbi:hypothetical protein F444_00493 [Phytophthora nicotianae P1976]|uniref:Uncharacterized protein n=1 Tax=Phytophthora nicotianae P1976 TaxID=1317066 RepID=A0A081B451_PHYNI|nr:hypothetical protein F444_00493 [Phytophthora nicotianae P1976]